MVELYTNSGDPDQMPQSVTSDLGLHFLPVTLLGAARLQWVNNYRAIAYFLSALQSTQIALTSQLASSSSPTILASFDSNVFSQNFQTDMQMQAVLSQIKLLLKE